MALFWRRTKERFTAPAHYIQATDSVSRPLAVLSSLLILFVCGAVLVGLFFGGKWAYNQATGKDTGSSNPITGISTGASTSNGSSGTAPSSTSSASVTSNGTGSATVTPSQTSTATVTAQASSNTKVATTSSVPNTGSGSVIGLFLAATLIGMLLYRAVLIRTLH